MEIRTIDNGYILREGGSELFCENVQELFQRLLVRLEGRGECSGGDLYGVVFVADQPGEKFVSPDYTDPA